MLEGVACKEKRNILFYILLHDFINSSAFVDINLCYQLAINVIRETFIFYVLSLTFFRILWLDKIFVIIILDKLFFIWESKKWLLVMLDSTDRTGICLDRLRSGHLTEVVV